jgi:hypothetical protein
LPLRLRRPIQTIHDYRNQLNALELLKTYLDQPGAIIFAEGGHQLKGKVADRYNLGPSPTLVVWSTPPGQSELQAILDNVAPRQIAWFGLPTANDQIDGFIRRLSGLVRFAIKNRQGLIYIPELASATAQQEVTIEKGLSWLAARGNIHIQQESQGHITVSLGGSRDLGLLPALESDLNYLLKETAAFRAYCDRTDLQILLSG